VTEKMNNCTQQRVNGIITFASLLRRPRIAEALAEAQAAGLRRLKGFGDQ